MALDWTNLRVFVEVARAGGIVGASKELGLSAPTVRRRLRSLEEACGFPLTERGGDGVKLTPVGVRLLERAEDVGRAVTGGGPMEAVERPRVLVATGELLASFLLPPVLRDVRLAEPGLNIRVRTFRVSDELNTLNADIAVKTFTPGRDQAVTCRVGALRGGLYAHRDYVAAAGAPRSVADLAKFRLVGAESDDVCRAVIRQWGLSLEPADFAFRTDSMLGQVAAARGGIGIAAAYCDHLEGDADLVRILPELEPRFDLHVWATASRLARPEVRRVFDNVVDRLRRRFDAAVPGDHSEITN